MLGFGVSSKEQDVLASKIQHNIIMSSDGSSDQSVSLFDPLGLVYGSKSTIVGRLALRKRQNVGAPRCGLGAPQFGLV